MALTPTLTPTLLLTCLLVLPAAAGMTMVEFQDGRIMPVEAIAHDDEGRAWLTLKGGARIAVPVERISGWEQVDDPAPAVAPPAATRRQLWQLEAGEYATRIEVAANRHDLDPALLTAVAQVESAFDPWAVSPKGAQGLLQLMPATADRFGVRDPFDVDQNLDGGARYLSWLLEHFEGRHELALAGYNAGEGTVARYRGVPPYPETRQYVKKVMAGATRLARYAP